MINPWMQGRAGVNVPMYPPLGAWMSRRKLASAGWVPPYWMRLQLAGAHGYFYQFTPRPTLAAGETQLLRLSVSEDFWLMTVLALGSSALANNAGTFRFQIYQDNGEYYYSKYGVNQNTGSCNANEPGLRIYPHFIRGGTAVNCRVQNLDGANPNTVDICLWGYSGWWRQTGHS